MLLRGKKTLDSMLVSSVRFCHSRSHAHPTQVLMANKNPCFRILFCFFWSTWNLFLLSLFFFFRHVIYDRQRCHVSLLGCGGRSYQAKACDSILSVSCVSARSICLYIFLYIMKSYHKNVSIINQSIGGYLAQVSDKDHCFQPFGLLTFHLLCLPSLLPACQTISTFFFESE